MNNKKQYCQKQVCTIILIICFMLNTYSLFVARDSPATGYEFSIYKSTPFILWCSIILSLVVGITIIFYQIYTSKGMKEYLSRVSLILIILCYIICLSIYIIRGYYAWSMVGDPSSHISAVELILSKGHIIKNLVYPISHIYMSETYLMTDIDILDLSKYLPLLFGIMYIPFMYLSAKLILPRNNQIVLATLASATFAHEYYLSFTPNHLSNLFFPFLLYVFLRSMHTRKVQWSVLMIILAFTYPLFHPLPTVIFLIFIISYSLTSKFICPVVKSKNNDYVSVRMNYNLLFMLLVWTILWISSFEIWKYNILSIHESIVGAGSSYLSDLMNQANTATSYGYSVTNLVIKRMGVPIIYFISTLTSFPIVFKYIKSGNNYSFLFNLYGPLFILSLILFMLYFTKMSFGPLRIVTYIVIICSIFMGFLVEHIINNAHHIKKKLYRYLIILSLIVVILGIFTGGIINVYPSPYISSQNLQTTEHVVEGMDWILHTRNLSIETTGMTISKDRLSLLALSIDELNQIGLVDESHVLGPFPKNVKVPYHFGYENNSSLANSYHSNIYLLITIIDRQIYKQMLPEMEKYRWSQRDYIRLDNDEGVNKLYSNGEMDTYFVKH